VDEDTEMAIVEVPSATASPDEGAARKIPRMGGSPGQE